MEKGRHRFSVTADAYGLTISGISRSLASRPPYRTPLCGTPEPVLTSRNGPGGVGNHLGGGWAELAESETVGVVSSPSSAEPSSGRLSR